MIDINDHPFLRNDFQLDNPIVIDGITFPTVEHAFQAAKTTDIDERKRIATLSVREARQAGREFNLDSYSWDTKKYFVMENLLKAKFDADDSLAKKLISLSGKISMVSDRDSFWGMDPDTDAGENNMGVILASIRDELSLKADILGYVDEPDEEEDDSDEEPSIDLAVLTTKPRWMR